MSPPAPARRIWAIVPAAGRGSRFETALPKQYAQLQGRTVLEWTLGALLAEPRLHAVVVVVAAEDPHWAALRGRLDQARILTTLGGASRQASVRNGLAHLEGRAAADDWVLVHDAARPCLSGEELGRLIAALDRGAAGAVLAAPLVDTIKREREGLSAATVDRRGLWRALTPQVFPFAALRDALDDALRDAVEVTDEAQALERLGVLPQLVPGSSFNIKVTRPEDLAAASRILQIAGADMMRVGQGFDAHVYGDGDHVTLGGVRIAHHRGVIAHSDGDVVIHALCDALLGAIGQGDIGQHFPDTDPKHRGADSRLFLRSVAARIADAGFRLVNADLTVLAEAPRIAAHRAAMSGNLAADLSVSPRLINVKATTTERMGFIGRGEGIAALAAVLLQSLGA